MSALSVCDPRSYAGRERLRSHGSSAGPTCDADPTGLYWRHPDRPSEQSYDSDDNSIHFFGHAAGAAEERTATAFVKRYYAAAAAGNGARACSLLSTEIAGSVVEQYGRPPGPPGLRGTSCAVVMSKETVRGTPWPARSRAGHAPGNRRTRSRRPWLRAAALDGNAHRLHRLATRRPGMEGRNAAWRSDRVRVAMRALVPRRWSGMRTLLVLLTAVLLGAGLLACGGAGGGSGSVSQDGLGGTYLHEDNDADTNIYNEETDDQRTREFGKAASPEDTKAVIALVRRFYAAAAAGDGAAACSLMAPSLARDAGLSEAAEAAHPPVPGAPNLHGDPCPTVMSLLFKEDHEQLVAESATLVVTGVRVEGAHGLALLGFKTMPERWILVAREHGAWTIDAPLDSELT